MEKCDICGKKIDSYYRNHDLCYDCEAAASAFAIALSDLVRTTFPRLLKDVQKGQKP